MLTGHFSIRSNAYLRCGKFFLALKDVQSCLELNPNMYSALCTRAEALRHLKNFDQALIDCRKAIQINKLDPVPRKTSALIKASRCWYDEAIVDCNVVIDSLSTTSKDYLTFLTLRYFILVFLASSSLSLFYFFFYRATCYARINDTSSSIKDWVSLLEIKPNDVNFIFNLSLCYSKEQKWKEVSNAC